MLLGLAACRPAEPLRLGFLGSVSGSVSELGVPARDGALLAVELRNAAGGVAGRRVEMVVRDDSGGAAAARKAVSELIDLKVDAIVGPQISATALATLDLVNAAQIVMMSPTATAAELGGRDDYFFRVAAGANVTATMAARYQFEKLGHRRIAATLDLGNAAYARGWLAAFEAELSRLGGAVVATLPYTSAPDTDFTGIARGLLRARPDAVVLIAGAVDTAELCQQLRTAVPALTIVATEWAGASSQFAQLGGRAVEGVYLTQAFDRASKAPAYLAFVEAYRKRYNREAGQAAFTAYDAASVVLDALARRAAGENLKQTLLKIGRFEGLQGPVALDRYGDATRAIYIASIRDGRLVALD